MKKTKKIVIFSAFLVLLFALGALLVAASDDEGYTVKWVLNGETTSEAVESLPSYSAGDLVPFGGKSYKVESCTVSGNTATVTLNPTAYYYSITDASGKETLYTSYTEDAFYSNFQGAVSGSTVKLLSNVTVREKNNGLNVYANKTLYFDLNGFDFVRTYKNSDVSAGYDCFSINAGATFHVYSSRPGARIFNSQYNSKGETVAYAIFTLNGADARVFVGDHGTEGTDGFCDGDNLTVYGTMLGQLWCWDTDTSDSVANLNVSGGAYYETNANQNMFLLRSCSNATDKDKTQTLAIKDAKLYARSQCIFSFYEYAAAHSTKQFKVDVKNSVLYSTNSIIAEALFFNGRCTVDFYDSYLLADSGAATLTGVSLHEGCRTVLDAPLASGCVTARAQETLSVTFMTNTFSYTTGEDGTSVTLNDSSLETVAEKQFYRFNSAVAKETETSNITWVTDEATVTERWCNGVVPVPPMSVPEATDIYKFSFGNVTAANGDKTYTLTQVAAFDIKLNLSLYDNFRYNVYIPEAAKSAVTSVKVDGNAIAEPEAVLIYGAPYYKYTFGIYPKRGAETYSFVMTVAGHGGATFEQECLLSIPAYAFAIKEGNYNQSANTLVEKTLLYINAVYEYSGTTDSTGALAKLFERYDIYPDKVHAVSGTDMGTAPTEVKAVIAGASAVMGDTFKFRFTLQSGVSDDNLTSTSATVSYYENRKLITKDIKDLLTGATDDEGRRYFDISLRAADMQKDITLTVSGKNVTYNLAKYVKGVSSDEKNTKLAKNIWWYSEAAKNFVNQKPTIDIEGTPLTDYTIVAATAKEQAAAEILAQAIETKLGEKPAIVASAESATGKTIRVESIASDSPQDFYVSCEGGELRFECAFDSLFEGAMKSFVNAYIAPVESSYSFKNGFKQEYFASKVYYSDFGAVGDGETNDFFNLKAAHDVANAKSLTVYADAGKTYYIGTTVAEGAATATTIEIKTNVVWTGAKIIIDDTNLTKTDTNEYNLDVFTVKSDYVSSVPDETIAAINEAGGISRTDKKIDLGLGYSAMLVIWNKDHKQFLRFGVNQDKGQEQRELVLIDENGKIDASTPLLFDFERVTSIAVYRADITPITIEGGEIETRASQVNTTSNIYMHRGIAVNRSNVTVSNVKHTVTGEKAKDIEVSNATIAAINAEDSTKYYYSTSSLQTSGLNNKVYYYETQADKVRIYTDSDGKSNPVVKTSNLGVSYSKDNDNTYTFKTNATFYNYMGHAYYGFLFVQNATNVDVVGCEFVGRTYYWEGTYDITATMANAVTFKNCTQSNFLDDDGRPTNMGVKWGVMGSNYCKNLTYDGCTLSRYDAHCGLVNGKIVDSIVQHVSLTGGGTMTIENTLLVARSGTGYGNSGVVLNIREDYGSTWDGSITLKNVHYVTDQGDQTTANVTVSTWTNHYFGYATKMPNLVVDSLKFTADMSGCTGFAFSDASPAYLTTYTKLKDITCPVTTVNLYSLNQCANDKNTYTYDENAGGVDYSAATVTIETVGDGMSAIGNNFGETYTTGESKNYNPYTPPEYYVVENMVDNMVDGVTYNLYTGSVASSFFDGTTEGYPKNPFDTPFVDYVP